MDLFKGDLVVRKERPDKGVGICARNSYYGAEVDDFFVIVDWSDDPLDTTVSRVSSLRLATKKERKKHERR